MMFDMRRTSWKRIVGIASIAIQVLTVACDPSMIIRQASVPGKTPNAGTSPEAQVEVSAKTTRQFIGETWYDPEVKVTNLSDSPITVTDIELSARGKAYAGKWIPWPRPGAFPLTIHPGNSGTLEITFRLDEVVWKTFFRHPAELLVYYTMGTESKVARTTIVGAHLDGTP
jgi:hypothetical protein